MKPHATQLPTDLHLVGAGLVIASAISYSLAGVLTKSIASDALTIACWRGLVGGLLISAYVLLRRRRAAATAPLRLGWRGWLLASVGAAASIAFISAFKSTYVANVAVIYATAPFLAALLERVVLGQAFRRQTMLAALLSFAGVGLMVGPGLGGKQIAGDGLALLMTLGSALYMVLIRAFRDTPVVWAGGVSGLMLFGLGWLVADPLAISAEDAVAVVVFGLFFALAVILWTEGTRLIPASESGLLGSAEVPFAALFAAIFLGEIPPVASVAAGAIVLAAVFGHAALDLARSRRSVPKQMSGLE